MVPEQLILLGNAEKAGAYVGFARAQGLVAQKSRGSKPQFVLVRNLEGVEVFIRATPSSTYIRITVVGATHLHFAVYTYEDSPSHYFAYMKHISVFSVQLPESLAEGDTLEFSRVIYEDPFPLLLEPNGSTFTNYIDYFPGVGNAGYITGANVYDHTTAFASVTNQGREYLFQDPVIYNLWGNPLSYHFLYGSTYTFPYQTTQNITFYRLHIPHTITEFDRSHDYLAALLPGEQLPRIFADLDDVGYEIWTTLCADKFFYSSYTSNLYDPNQHNLNYEMSLWRIDSSLINADSLTNPPVISLDKVASIDWERTEVFHEYESDALDPALLGQQEYFIRPATSHAPGIICFSLVYGSSVIYPSGFLTATTPVDAEHALVFLSEDDGESYSFIANIEHPTYLNLSVAETFVRTPTEIYVAYAASHDLTFAEDSKFPSAFLVKITKIEDTWEQETVFTFDTPYSVGIGMIGSKYFFYGSKPEETSQEGDLWLQANLLDLDTMVSVDLTEMIDKETGETLNKYFSLSTDRRDLSTFMDVYRG